MTGRTRRFSREAFYPELVYGNIPCRVCDLSIFKFRDFPMAHLLQQHNCMYEQELQADDGEC